MRCTRMAEETVNLCPGQPARGVDEPVAVAGMGKEVVALGHWLVCRGSLVDVGRLACGNGVRTPARMHDARWHYSAVRQS